MTVFFIYNLSLYSSVIDVIHYRLLAVTFPSGMGIFLRIPVIWEVNPCLVISSDILNDVAPLSSWSGCRH